MMRASAALALAVLLLTTTACASDDVLRTSIVTETQTQTRTLTQVSTQTQTFMASPEVVPATPQTTLDPLVDTAAQVVSTYDGDTTRVLYHGESTPVRILGIQAPELANEGLGVEAGCYGVEARDSLRSLLPPGQEVYLVIDPQQGDGPYFTDKNDRLLRYVEVRTDQGTTDVGEHQIRSGNATVYDEYPVNRTPFYQLAEDAARSDDAGLWGACPR